MNSAESCLIADRISRLTFVMLKLSSNPGSFGGAKIFAEQLLGVFAEAVKLLEKFQPIAKQNGFIQIITSCIAMYSESSINLFHDIHNQLTTIMLDRTFALSVAEEDALRPPTLE